MYEYINIITQLHHNNTIIILQKWKYQKKKIINVIMIG